MFDLEASWECDRFVEGHVLACKCLRYACLSFNETGLHPYMSDARKLTVVHSYRKVAIDNK